MSEISLESKLNPKELNKILPSYLIDEVKDDKIDEEESKKKNSEAKITVSKYYYLLYIGFFFFFG